MEGQPTWSTEEATREPYPRPRASTEAVLDEHLSVGEHPFLVVVAAVSAVAEAHAVTASAQTRERVATR